MSVYCFESAIRGKWECGERSGDPAEGSIEAGFDAVHERLHLVAFGLMGLVKRDKRLR